VKREENKNNFRFTKQESESSVKSFNNMPNIIKKPTIQMKKKIDFISRNKLKIREMSQEIKNKQPRIRHNMDIKFIKRQKTPLDRPRMMTANLPPKFGNNLFKKL